MIENKPFIGWVGDGSSGGLTLYENPGDGSVPTNGIELGHGIDAEQAAQLREELGDLLGRIMAAQDRGRGTEGTGQAHGFHGEPAADLVFTDFPGQLDRFGAEIVSVGVNASLDEHPSLIAVQSFNTAGDLEASALGVCLKPWHAGALLALLTGTRYINAQERDGLLLELGSALYSVTNGAPGDDSNRHAGTLVMGVPETDVAE